MTHALPMPYPVRYALGTHTLSPIQSDILRDQHRVQVVSAGRRAGKTYASACRAIQVASEIPGALVVIMAPTIQQVRDLYQNLLLDLLPPAVLSDYNKTERRFLLSNGSVIHLAAAEALQRCRGLSITYIILDEVSSFGCSLDELFAVLRPALSDQRSRLLHPLAGGVLAISTPDGTKGAFWNLYDRACQPDAEDWRAFQFSTLDGGNVSREEIEAAKAEMGIERFRAEYLASFHAGTAHRVLHAFNRDEHVTELAEDDDTSPVVIGMDLNVGELCAAVARRVGPNKTSRGGLLVFDCISLENSHTQAMAAAIRARFPNRRVIVYPDASGSQRKTSAGGQTDHSILQAAGFTVDPPASNPAVADRINTVNWSFKDANGRARLLIHPRAERLLECIESQVYIRTPSGLVPDKGQRGGMDYSGQTDALGYLVWRSMPMPAPTRRAWVVPFRGFA